MAEEATDREVVLRTVTALVDGPQEAAHVLLGEAGVGRSHALAAIAHAASTTSVLVRARPHESDVPLSGLSAVMAAVSSELMIDFSGRFTLASTAPERLFAAAQDLLGVIRGFHLEPVLVLIDDVDHMDPASQELLALMASRLAGTGLRLVLTAHRGGDRQSLWRGLPTTSLGPLGDSDIIEIGQHHAPEACDDALGILARYCRGNAGIFHEMLNGQTRTALTGASWLVLPPRGGPVMEQFAVARLAGLSDDQVLALRHVALVPLAVHDAVATVTGAGVVDDLIDAGLLIQDGPYLTVVDPRIRSHVVWSMSLTERRDLDAVLARAHATHPWLGAWHAHVADDSGEDTSRALLEAATSWARDGHVDGAVECAERALLHSQHPDAHAEALVGLAAALLERREVTIASRYLDAIRLAMAAPHLVLEVARLRTLVLLLSVGAPATDEALTLLRLHAPADPTGAARFAALTGWLLMERWHVAEARSLLTTLTALVPGEQMSDAAAIEVRALADLIDAFDGTEQRVRVDPQTSPAAELVAFGPQALVMHATAAVWRGRHDDARQLLGIAVNLPSTAASVWDELAHRALVQNEIASQHFRRAVAVGMARPVPTHGTTTSSSRSYFLAWAAFCEGRADEAQEHLTACLELVARENLPKVRARALELQANLHLAAGDHESAVREYRRVNALAARYPHPGRLRHFADHVEACHLAGRQQEAGAVLAAFERRASQHPSRWSDLTLARARAIISADPDAAEAFQDAVDMFELDEYPYERGRTLHSSALRYEAMGLAEEARRAREHAADAFESAGALTWHARCRATDASAVSRTAPLARLTAEEREIIRLVHDGARNREIAAAMYLSIRTVELRLTRIYRSLGLKSRTELIAMLDRGEHPLSGPNES